MNNSFDRGEKTIYINYEIDGSYMVLDKSMLDK